ncbi:MAG TPA: hypothetical protein VGK59_03985 [Ohtaekwangia sp.]
MIRVKDTQTSLDHVRFVFLHNKRAFYSRFGDADIYMIMGRNAANHSVTPELSKEMTAAFQIDHPLYLRGLAVNHPRERGMVRGLFAIFKANQEMIEFLDAKFGSVRDVVFENPVFLHYLGVFQPHIVNKFLAELIRPKCKMYIGCIPKDKVEKLIGSVHYYVETPARNAYATIDQWWPNVVQHIHDVELIIPAAGQATRVINKRLWEMGVEIQSFDIGSLVDVADERQTRKWIRLAGHRIDRYIINSHKNLNFTERMIYLRGEVKLKMYSLIKSLT